MSTNNAARFYWVKLERATTLSDRGALKEAHDVCCQLGNEFRCPRFCQIEAWKLGSRCFPDNYWFAKSMLDIALRVVADCETSDEANDCDMAALAEVKEGVEKMLAERDAEYRQYWQKQGGEPPSMEEWYDIMEGGNEDGSTASDDWNIIEGEAGNWPFPPGFGMSHHTFGVVACPLTHLVPSSALVGKTLPPGNPRESLAERQERGKEERQHEEE